MAHPLVASGRMRQAHVHFCCRFDITHKLLTPDKWLKLLPPGLRAKQITFKGKRRKSMCCLTFMNDRANSFKDILKRLFCCCRFCFGLWKHIQILSRQSPPNMNEISCANSQKKMIYILFSHFLPLLGICLQSHRRHGRTHVWPTALLRSALRQSQCPTLAWKRSWKCREDG